MSTTHRRPHADTAVPLVVIVAVLCAIACTAALIAIAASA
jgi:hypothetical protein